MGLRIWAGLEWSKFGEVGGSDDCFGIGLTELES
jgi:hypothetical protein